MLSLCARVCWPARTPSSRRKYYVASMAWRGPPFSGALLQGRAAHHPRRPFVWSDGSPTVESPGRENSAPERPDTRPDTPTRSSTDAGGGRRGGNGSRAAARPSARAHDRNAVEPTRLRGRRGVAAGPARRRPQRAAAAPSQSLVNRRRPVLSVMVVASRPFDMVPDGLRAQSGQLFGGRGLLYGGRGARWAA